MLERIANLTWNHPRKILGAALLFAAVAGFFGHDVEHHLKAAGFTDPSSESEQAGDVLSDALGYSAPARPRRPGPSQGRRPARRRGPGRARRGRPAGRPPRRVRRTSATSTNPLTAGPGAANLIAADGRSLVL